MAKGKGKGRGKLLLVLVVLLGAGWWWLDGGLPQAKPPKAAKAKRDVVTAVEPAEPAADAEPIAAQPAAARPFVSWSGAEPLRPVFAPRPRSLVDVASPEADPRAADTVGMGAVEPADTAVVAFTPDLSDDWPEHVVSVVLVGREGRLAVVDSTVVLVGDDLAAGEIVQIHDRGVVVRSGGTLVDYLLGSSRPQPRNLVDHGGGSP